MPYLNLEMGKPVRVTWDGQFPQYDSSKQYPKHEYNLEVDGQWFTFAATDKTHKDIQQFCQMNGKQFAIVKVPYTKFKSDGFVYNIEPWDIQNSPQNADMYGQSGSQYAKQEKPLIKPQQDPDWDKIKEDKQDDILKGQCRNLAHAEYVAEKIKDEEIVPRITQLYLRFKNMNWELEAQKPATIPTNLEEPPPISDEDFPF